MTSVLAPKWIDANSFGIFMAYKQEALWFHNLTSLQYSGQRRVCAIFKIYSKSSIYHKRIEIKSKQIATLVRIFIIQYFCAYIFVSFFLRFVVFSSIIIILVL